MNVDDLRMDDRAQRRVQGSQGYTDRRLRVVTLWPAERDQALHGCFRNRTGIFLPQNGSTHKLPCSVKIASAAEMVHHKLRYCHFYYTWLFGILLIKHCCSRDENVIDSCYYFEAEKPPSPWT